MTEKKDIKTLIEKPVNSVAGLAGLIAPGVVPTASGAYYEIH